MNTKWIKVSLLNLLIVGFIGVVLRYKIIFSLSFVEQKHLLHGHSHFAFSGWVSMILMTIIVSIIAEQKQQNSFAKYKWLLIANLIAAYGMLISFPIQGYGLFSISFSTLSIFVAYVFAIVVWKDLSTISTKNIWGWWLKAALIFNALSSLGAFSLAYLMINKIIHQNWYLEAIYFFLHFQYNGWFLFSIGGFVMYLLEKNGLYKPVHKNIFYLFAFACVPAYFLSVLWMQIPLWMYILVITAALAQFIGWLLFLHSSQKSIKSLLQNNVMAKWLITFSAVAFSIKVCLQLGSTIPFLSTLAFGYRPIVIGYLHLALLGVITLFLLGYLFYQQYFQKPIHTKGAITFTAGVILNELLLMIQGVTAMGLIVVPYVNELLLTVACIMFIGLLLLQWNSSRNNSILVD